MHPTLNLISAQEHASDLRRNAVRHRLAAETRSTSAAGRRRASWQGLIVGLTATLAAALAVFGVPAAHADVIVQVNSVGDRPDESPDGICDVAPNMAGQQCTLRGAIQETNAVPGSDLIRFGIPGTGVHRIAPATQLPHITGPVEINGYTQPGASPNTNDATQPDNALLRIELSGQGAGSLKGLWVMGSAAGTLIKGLAINGFDSGVVFDAGTTIRGDFIGTDPTGTAARPNVVGLVGNGLAVVGGTQPEDRNVISGNEFDGMDVEDAVGVHGNFIGTQSDGVSPLGNGDNGIAVSGSDNLIGGSSGAANVIAFNRANGIRVDGTGDSLSRNRIFGNEALGIDLDADGITPNDPLDADTGANELQNYPVLKRALTGPNATTIQGVLNSTPNRSFTIEFFASPKGTGREGKRFIGQRALSTGGDGKVKFGFQPSQPVAVGNSVTATAAGFGGTSEFSAPRTVTAP